MIGLVTSGIVEAYAPSQASAKSAPATASYRDLMRLPLARGSVSIGTPLRGRLYRSARLSPQGPDHRVLARTRRRRATYGTDELVGLITRTAAAVALRFPGSRLVVGNLSRRHGSWLRQSRSHQTGRDADLLFYVRYRGRMVTPRCMRRFGRQLRSMGHRRLVFDVSRNWALVKTLLSDRAVQVQWIIVADHLRRALLRRARFLREPSALVARAALVMNNPRVSGAHDNHFHVRIYCARDDRLAGCKDLAPFWRWINTYEPAVQRRLAQIFPGLHDRSPAVRIRVLRYLGLLGDHRLSERIARIGLRDSVVSIRRSTARLLRRWGWRRKEYRRRIAPRRRLRRRRL